MSKRIARVNGTYILQKQLDDMMMIHREQTGVDRIDEETKQRLFDQIVCNTLLLEEAVRRGETVEPAVLDRQVEEVSEKFASEEAFLQALADHHINLEIFRKNVADTLLLQQITRKIMQEGVVLTAEMLESCYEENGDRMMTPERVSASHILIAKDESGSFDRALERIQEILGDIRKGGDFAQMAREHSQCPSAEKGGQLGIFGRGQMVPEFEKVAFALGENEVSEPVRTSFGYHLIRVEQRLPARKLSFKEAQPHIEKFVYQQEGQRVLEELTDRLKAEASIERL